jgi:hypothetical protein
MQETELKPNFSREIKKTERKWLKIFLRRHQEISVTTIEVLHSRERGNSLLKQ